MAASVAGGTDAAAIYFKNNGMATPNTRMQMCVKWKVDGSTTVIAESPAY